jgi:signal transduction histidine kinase
VNRSTAQADLALALVATGALMTEAALSGRRHGPLMLNVLTVGAMGASAGWRRRSPLGFAALVGAGAIALSGGLTSFRYASLAGTYTVLLPTYTIGAEERRGRAILGLVGFLAGASAIEVVHRAPMASFVPAALTATAAWAAGRAVHTERQLTRRLEHRSVLLAVERDERIRLAAAAERALIARELHAAVAHGVAGLVVQAEAAQRLIDTDAPGCEATLDRLERTAREALAEMRRILGVLRRPDERADLEPQPGLGQVNALVARASAGGRDVRFELDGENGAVPAPVGLAVYRIVEDALAEGDGGLAVRVTRRRDELGLELTGRRSADGTWPTPVASERVALCGGRLEVSTHGGTTRLVVRLPIRSADEVPA